MPVTNVVKPHFLFTQCLYFFKVLIMKQLLVIRDADVGFKEKQAKYHTRTAARTILKKGNLIALLHVSKHNYYKLPGGGVDKGESIKEGLKREILEEVGCTFKLVGEIGEILEYRSEISLKQTSFCFLAEVEKEGKPEFTSEELENGFELVWITLDKAMNLVQNGKPDTYDGKFIVKRDFVFLKEAKQLLLSADATY